MGSRRDMLFKYKGFTNETLREYSLHVTLNVDLRDAILGYGDSIETRFINYYSWIGLAQVFGFIWFIW